MKLQKIAEGNTAEVYSWGENDILKLFRKDFPVGAIEKEYRVSKAIEKLGLAIPRVGDIIEYEGRTGIIYERIEGASLLRLISEHPWSAGRNARKIAQMHYDMHKCKAEGLPDCKEALRWGIKYEQDLSQEQKQEILNILEKLPEGSFVCHGDYHPGNIIKNYDQYIILDWMTAVAGQPSYDVARTILLLQDASIPEEVPAFIKFVMNLVRKQIANSYLKQYMKLSGISREEIDAWRLPIIAARLSEWIPENEREVLRKEISEKIGAK